jgi:hypothetical protein
MAALFKIGYFPRREKEPEIRRVIRRAVWQRVCVEAIDERMRDRLAGELVRGRVLIEAEPGVEPDDRQHAVVRLRVQRQGDRHDELRPEGSALAPDRTAVDGDGSDEPTSAEGDALLVDLCHATAPLPRRFDELDHRIEIVRPEDREAVVVLGIPQVVNLEHASENGDRDDVHLSELLGPLSGF